MFGRTNRPENFCRITNSPRRHSAAAYFAYNGFERSAKLGGESDSKMSWIANRCLIHIILLGTVAAWWALWDFQSQSALLPTLELHLRGIPPTLVNLLSFWLPPMGAIATANLICSTQDRTILGRRWTTGDILRLTCWRTVSPFASLLFVVAGFDAIYDRKLISILWLVAAAFSGFIGAALLRSAEGMKLRRVRSGQLYKRAFVLAKNMAIRLERLYFVPAGRGHLTNAYGLSQSIAVTDNYGRFLNGPQLDFIIGHELAHVREPQTQKAPDRSSGLCRRRPCVLQPAANAPAISTIIRCFSAVSPDSDLLFLLTSFRVRRGCRFDQVHERPRGRNSSPRQSASTHSGTHGLQSAIGTLPDSPRFHAAGTRHR